MAHGGGPATQSANGIQQALDFETEIGHPQAEEFLAVHPATAGSSSTRQEIFHTAKAVTEAEGIRDWDGLQPRALGAAGQAVGGLEAGPEPPETLQKSDFEEQKPAKSDRIHVPFFVRGEPVLQHRIPNPKLVSRQVGREPLCHFQERRGLVIGQPDQPEPPQ